MFDYFRNCSTSEAHQVCCPVRIVQLKVYMTIASPMALNFIELEGHVCLKLDHY